MRFSYANNAAKEMAAVVNARLKKRVLAEDHLLAFINEAHVDAVVAGSLSSNAPSLVEISRLVCSGSLAAIYIGLSPSSIASELLPLRRPELTYQAKNQPSLDEVTELYLLLDEISTEERLLGCVALLEALLKKCDTDTRNVHLHLRNTKLTEKVLQALGNVAVHGLILEDRTTSCEHTKQLFQLASSQQALVSAIKPLRELYICCPRSHLQFRPDEFITSLAALLRAADKKVLETLGLVFRFPDSSIQSSERAAKHIVGVLEEATCVAHLILHASSAEADSEQKKDETKSRRMRRYNQSLLNKYITAMTSSATSSANTAITTEDIMKMSPPRDELTEEEMRFLQILMCAWREKRNYMHRSLRRYANYPRWLSLQGFGRDRPVHPQWTLCVTRILNRLLGMEVMCGSSLINKELVPDPLFVEESRKSDLPYMATGPSRDDLSCAVNTVDSLLIAREAAMVRQLARRATKGNFACPILQYTLLETCRAVWYTKWSAASTLLPLSHCASFTRCIMTPSLATTRSELVMRERKQMLQDMGDERVFGALDTPIRNADAIMFDIKSNTAAVSSSSSSTSSVQQQQQQQQQTSMYAHAQWPESIYSSECLSPSVLYYSSPLSTLSKDTVALFSPSSEPSSPSSANMLAYAASQMNSASTPSPIMFSFQQQQPSTPTSQQRQQLRTPPSSLSFSSSSSSSSWTDLSRMRDEDDVASISSDDEDEEEKETRITKRGRHESDDGDLYMGEVERKLSETNITSPLSSTFVPISKAAYLKQPTPSPARKTDMSRFTSMFDQSDASSSSSSSSTQARKDARTRLVESESLYAKRRRGAVAAAFSVLHHTKDFLIDPDTSLTSTVRMIPLFLLARGVEASVYYGLVIERDAQGSRWPRVRLGALRYRNLIEDTDNPMSRLINNTGPIAYCTWNEICHGVMMSTCQEETCVPKLLAVRHVPQSGAVISFSELVQDAMISSRYVKSACLETETVMNMLYCLRKNRIIHSDMHYGNVIVTATPKADCGLESSSQARYMLVDLGISRSFTEYRHLRHVLALSKPLQKRLHEAAAKRGVSAHAVVSALGGETTVLVLVLMFWPEMIDNIRSTFTLSVLNHAYADCKFQLSLPSTPFSMTTSAVFKTTMGLALQNMHAVMHAQHDIIMRLFNPYSPLPSTRKTLDVLLHCAIEDKSRSISRFVYGSNVPVNTTVTIQELLTVYGCEVDCYGQMALARHVLRRPYLPLVLKFDKDACLQLSSLDVSERCAQVCGTVAWRAPTKEDVDSAPRRILDAIKQFVALGLHHAAGEAIYWSSIVNMMRFSTDDSVAKQKYDTRPLLSLEQIAELMDMRRTATDDATPVTDSLYSTQDYTQALEHMQVTKRGTSSKITTFGTDAMTMVHSALDEGVAIYDSYGSQQVVQCPTASDLRLFESNLHCLLF